MPSVLSRNCRAAVMAACLIALCPLGGGSLSAQTTTVEGEEPAGFGSFVSDEDQFPCVSSDEYDRLWTGFGGLAPASPVEVPDSTYEWPLSLALHDGVILVNYVDDLQSGVGDYMGYPHSYEGHWGTDMTLLNFRSMDRGVPVLAAADGIVVSTQDGQFDRNTGTGFGSANFVRIDHGGGNHALYLHFRKNSITVRPGESVRRGQMIGLTGSSGSSTDAHLHFEGRFNSNRRDPWSGPYNPIASLWRQQEPYVGTAPLRIYDMGVYNNAAAGGNASNVSFGRFKEKLSQPAIMGAGEQRLGVWLQFQGQARNTYRLEVRRPDNSLFSQLLVMPQTKIRYGWHYWYWLFAGAPLGTWTVSATTGSGETTSLQFLVGDATVFAPRFSPVAGRSFNVGQQVIQTLGVSQLGGPVDYSLRHAPANVSLDGSTVTIQPPSIHRRRSVFFQALATDQAGRQDTMWYHLVDFQAPNRVEVPARAFVRDGHRTIPDVLSSSQTCLRVEPVDGSFAASDVDPSTIFMTSWDTGSVEEIDAAAVKTAAVGDTDRNGEEEIPACFAREDMARLFSRVSGREVVEVEIGGDLATGERFLGKVELRILTTGSRPTASVSPNPLNSGGHLEFNSTRSGPMTVRMFDLSGRLVRTLMNVASVQPGAHSIRIDGRAADGENLPSGVYFYRIDAADGVTTGRFVLVK